MPTFILVLNILRRKDFREFNTTELGLHNYLTHVLDYKELIDLCIKVRERAERRKFQEKNH